MKKIIFVSALLVVCAIVSFSQTVKKTSLIVSSCEASEGTCDTQHVFRFDFVGGELAGKEKLLTAKTNELRFDIGENRIYKKRYLITNWGDVVDLSNGKTLHKSSGKLIDLDGDEVVIKVDRVDTQGIFSFNLQNGRYTRLKSPNIYEAEGSVSPDRKFIANYRFGKGISIKEFATGKEKLVKGAFGVELSPNASEFGKLPLFWLDNERLLTQASNGDIRIVHLSGKIEPVVKIDIKEDPYVSPRFYRNSDGEIVYDCYDSYVVDFAGKKFKPYENYPLGNGFAARDDESIKNNWGTGTIYFYRDAEIGRVWADRAVTMNDFIAVVYGKEGTNLGYSDGVKVWNAMKRDWTTLEIKWAPRIIGWIEE